MMMWSAHFWTLSICTLWDFVALRCCYAAVSAKLRMDNQDSGIYKEGVLMSQPQLMHIFVGDFFKIYFTFSAQVDLLKLLLIVPEIL